MIDNPKVATWPCSFAKYRSIGFLFENPSLSNPPTGPMGWNSDAKAHGEKLYRELSSALRCKVSEVRLMERYHYCTLTERKLHVSAAEVVNQENLNCVREPLREDFRRILTDLPASDHPLLSEIPAIQLDGQVNFRISRLEILDATLVAFLKPIGIASTAAVQKIQDFRLALSEFLGTAKPVRGTEKPEEVLHIAMGLFAESSRLPSAEHELPQWNEKVIPDIEHLSISFSRIRLYGFTTVEDFRPLDLDASKALRHA